LLQKVGSFVPQLFKLAHFVLSVLLRFVFVCCMCVTVWTLGQLGSVRIVRSWVYVLADV
jgi:hypothetical protein